MLVFGSVGDRGQAVQTWFDSNRTGVSKLAIVYYGTSHDGEWVRTLRSAADYFSFHNGGKFQNLLWWADANVHVLNNFDYVLVADDDIVLTTEMICRMVLTAQEYSLPVSAASHDWTEKISWRHMGTRGAGKRMAESKGGVELCNFVEMTCPLFTIESLWQFIDLFRQFADVLTGFGTDYIISNACFSEKTPFGVLHNVIIKNPRFRNGDPAAPREIDCLQSSDVRRQAWLDVVSRSAFSISSKRDVRSWLPSQFETNQLSQI